MAVIYSTADYLSQARALLPRGLAWICAAGSRMRRLLAGLAVEFARVDSRLADLRNEADPRSTLELLSEWEAFAGLPDTCAGGVATTIEERRATLAAKLLATGGASRAYYLSLCAALGYQVEIEVYRPFVCGRSRCGDLLNGGATVRHVWTVRVSGPRVTYFRVGQGQCGDSLGAIARATDLECKLQILKPAHTLLIVAYEGA